MKSAGVNGNIGELATRPVGRLLWDYSLPAVVGMLVMSLYNVIDRIFIGRGVGADAIAGLAITFPVMNVAAALGVLIGAGGASCTSIMLGRKDLRGAEQVLGNSLVLILINATIYLTCFAVWMDEILMAFGASHATLPYARDFMMYILPGMLMTNISFSFNNIMRASGYPTRAMVTMFIGAGVNVVLAPVFIFVLGWGIKGAAIATDIAMTVSAIFVMWHFFMPGSIVRFKRGIYRLRWHIVIGIIGIGAAPALVNAASSAINAIINTTLYRYGGDAAVGAAGIFTTYTSLICTVVVGLCQGMQPVIGYNYGAGRLDRMKRTYWLAVMVASAFTVIGCAFGLLFPRWIAMAFTIDAHLIDTTVNGLSLSLLMFWVVGFQIISTTFFQSIGKAGKSIFLSLTRQVIFLIPLLLLLPGSFGLDGVWLSFPASDMFATMVTAAMIWREFRRLD
ncbi:MAG: MATE family efflux transporter [Pseudoflavonifractor sp.]|nr:MATE family efflux transporter [Pseudoflavonifractor sp.]